MYVWIDKDCSGPLCPGVKPRDFVDHYNVVWRVISPGVITLEIISSCIYLVTRQAIEYDLFFYFKKFLPRVRQSIKNDNLSLSPPGDVFLIYM